MFRLAHVGFVNRDTAIPAEEVKRRNANCFLTKTTAAYIYATLKASLIIATCAHRVPTTLLLLMRDTKFARYKYQRRHQRSLLRPWNMVVPALASVVIPTIGVLEKYREYTSRSAAPLASSQTATLFYGLLYDLI